MKKILTLLPILLFSAFVLAQSPDAINYQAIARDTAGNVLANREINFRLSIQRWQMGGPVVYSETHLKTTNQFGLVTLEIGRGEVLSGSFYDIDWGSSNYYLETEMNYPGDNDYQLMGISQFLSVPYALYAKTAGNSIPVGTYGQTLRSDGSAWTPSSTIYNDGSVVGVGTEMPDPSAGLDVKFNNKGFLPPRMTFEQRNFIEGPAEGLMVYCTNCNADGTGGISIFQNGSWKMINLNCYSPHTPVAGSAVPDVTQITWKWNKVPISLGYKWNTTADYTSATYTGADTSITETGLSCNTSYTRYVWAYNSCGASAPVSMTQSTFSVPPPAPAPGTCMPGFSSIVWNWNPVPGVTGYRWSSDPADFYFSTDMGTTTTKLETGLNYGTTYTRYIRSYDDCGHSVNTVLTQTTSPLSSCAGFTDPRDGKYYNAVVIGYQCWMAQNLNIGTRVNGSVDQTDNGIREKYCYDDQESNCAVYGGLYQWAELVQYSNGATNTTYFTTEPTENLQGICPQGYHVPTHLEWTTLIAFNGGLPVAGGKMKETGTVHWSPPNTGATNSSGFTALPGGVRRDDVLGYLDFHTYGTFFSATETSSYNVYIYSLYNNSVQGEYLAHSKSWGRSVRCCKN